MAIEAGQVLLHYRVVEKLGEGGMGEVWKALDTSLGREVAIKLLPPSFAQDAERLARFEREARLLASLNHPNIATVYGLHEVPAPAPGEAPTRFLAMELIGGQDLSERLARGPVPLDEARAIALGIAQALEVAHDSGVIHRDLKPANVRLSTEGAADPFPKVKVLDFGLGKIYEPSRTSSDPGLSPTLTSAGTQAGMILGTAAYMSPEQARGRTVDRRTDIWSFGVVLWEMLAGRSLFIGETVSDTLAAVLTREPDLGALPTDTPASLRRLVDRCLDKDVTRRLQAIGEARIALLEPAQPAEPVQTPRGRRGAAPWVAGVLVVAAAAVAGFLAGRGGNSGAAAALPPAAGRFTQVTHDAGEEILPTLAPDGRSVAFQRRAGGDADIFLLRVGGENAINLTELSTVDDTAPAFSPDGELIAFRSERDGGGLFVMGATGESVRRLTDFGFNPAWSPDGRRIAFATEPVNVNPLSRGSVSELWLVEVDSGETRRLYAGDAVQPAWSPSGARIAFWRAGVTGGQRDLATLPAEGGEPTPVTNDAATDWSPVWSPDGHWLVFSTDRGGNFNLWRVAIDPASGRALAAPEPVTAGVGAEAYHAGFSADGSRLTFVSAESANNIGRVSVDPRTGAVDRGSFEIVVGGSITATAPSVSPDGEWLAYTVAGEREDLVVQRVDGTQRRRLTDDAAKDRMPRWFPDGRRILFYSDRGGPYQLWTIRPDGSDLKLLAGQPEHDNLLAEISADGRRVSMNAFREDSAARILTLDAAGDVVDVADVPRPAPDLALFITGFSPDGSRVAGEVRHPSFEPAGIVVYDFATRTYRTVADEGSTPVWLDDGRLLYASGDTVFLADLAHGTAPRAAYTLPSGVFNSRLALSHDRRHLYFSRTEREADVWMLTLPGATQRD